MADYKFWYTTMFYAPRRRNYVTRAAAAPVGLTRRPSPRARLARDLAVRSD